MPTTISYRLSHSYRWLLLAGVLLTLLIQWVALCWWARNQEQQVLDANRRYMTQLAGTVQEQALQLFAAIETRLRMVEFRLANHPGSDPLSDPEFIRLLDEVPPLGYRLPVRLISRSGRLALAGPTLNGSAIDVSQQRFFTAQLERSRRTLFIGATDSGALLGKQGIPVSWPIRLPTSDWAVAFSFIELDGLHKLHEPERILPNGTISLLHLDGTLLSRTPYAADYVGKSIRGSPNFGSMLARLKQGFFVSDSPVTDHVRRFVSFERVGNYPLVAAVSAGEDDVLAGFHQQRRLVFACGGILSLVLVGLGCGLWLSLQKMQLAAQTLEQMATTDPLTGRLNRRAFFAVAEREFERSRRYQTPLAVLMLDIDWFKRVNDTHGHAIGDTVLRTLAGAWFDSLRRLDCVGRIGGEEFAILLPQTSQQDALALAERLRQRTAAIEIIAPQGNFHVTVSIGLACVGSHDANFNQALERADMALYQAKQAGRNRVQST